MIATAVMYCASGIDPIVGKYMDSSHGLCAAHFNADGSIVFADGTRHGIIRAMYS